MVADSSCVQVPGPWEHRFLPSNGAQLHAALAGPDRPEAPLVVLLHTLPQFWFAWRHQITALADAGYRVAALDLRGCGGSDKPPHRHETYVKARDVVGVIRHLGREHAVVVGHGLGGAVAWSVPGVAPSAVRGLALLAAPHPVPLHQVRDGMSNAALAALARAQVPWFPERAVTHGDLVARLLTAWSAPGGRAEVLAHAALYTEVMRLPFAAHSAMEHVRWLVRSTPRPDGQRWLASLRAPVTVPVLSVRGSADPLLPARAYARDHEFVAGPLRTVEVPHAGHFLPEEAPGLVADALLELLHRL
ncbi:alpha/beta hydrolase [Georgenia sp. 10Sc9-8]|uniref:Alpha/beta hydrolase n=1 Tax=Georgenia halotolerans TaxID=3028317 RepID=A0ABT5U4J0_9MICO|nr:alpha/beta hydrolase [Georgenia halotolerans]